jgi:hypothetical protein
MQYPQVKAYRLYLTAVPRITHITSVSVFTVEDRREEEAVVVSVVVSVVIVLCSAIMSIT